jgi:homoaconitate hydratase
MGARDAAAYLASPEVVAASALSGHISGPGWYQKPEGVEKVIIGEGSGDHEVDKALSVEDALDKIIAQAESLIVDAEKQIGGAAAEETAAAADDAEEILTEILPGFPEKLEGEIVFCDADNINTDGIYPGQSPPLSKSLEHTLTIIQVNTHTKTTSPPPKWPKSAWRTTTLPFAQSPGPATS